MLVRVRGTPPDVSTSASSATARRKNNAPKAPGNSHLKTWRHFENQEGSRQRWVNAGPCIFSGTGYFTRFFLLAFCCWFRAQHLLEYGTGNRENRQDGDVGTQRFRPFWTGPHGRGAG